MSRCPDGRLQLLAPNVIEQHIDAVRRRLLQLVRLIAPPAERGRVVVQLTDQTVCLVLRARTADDAAGVSCGGRAKVQAPLKSAWTR
jgi:hypothetical protein